MEGLQIDLALAPVDVKDFVGIADTPNGRLVLVGFTTAQGVNAYHLAPEHALTLGQKLMELGRAAQSGIIIAGPGEIPPVPPNGQQP